MPASTIISKPFQMLKTLILCFFVLGKVSSFGGISSKHLQAFGTTAINVNLLVRKNTHATKRTFLTKLQGRFNLMPDA